MLDFLSFRLRFYSAVGPYNGEFDVFQSIRSPLYPVLQYSDAGPSAIHPQALLLDLLLPRYMCECSSIMQSCT